MITTVINHSIHATIFLIYNPTIRSLLPHPTVAGLKRLLRCSWIMRIWHFLANCLLLNMNSWIYSTMKSGEARENVIERVSDAADHVSPLWSKSHLDYFRFTHERRCWLCCCSGRSTDGFWCVKNWTDYGPSIFFSLSIISPFVQYDLGKRN